MCERAYLHFACYALNFFPCSSQFTLHLCAIANDVCPIVCRVLCLLKWTAFAKVMYCLMYAHLTAISIYDSTDISTDT